MKINLAGKDLTEYLIRLMAETNKEFSNIPETERDNARDTKEKKVFFKNKYKCYVVNDFEAEMKSFADS